MQKNNTQNAHETRSTIETKKNCITAKTKIKLGKEDSGYGLHDPIEYLNYEIQCTVLSTDL